MNKKILLPNSIGGKILLIFIGVSAAAVIAVTLIAQYKATSALKKRAFNQLEAVQQLKKSALVNFYKERHQEIIAMQGYYNVITNLPILSEYKGKRKDPIYLKSKKMVDNQIKEMFKAYDHCADIMFVDLSGEVVYVTAENAIDLGKQFDSKRFEKGKTGIYHSDILIHDGRNVQYIAAPIHSRDQDNRKKDLTGIIVLEIKVDEISKLMQERTGMGESGETYLVGDDMLMRSDSRFEKDSTILEKKVNTVAGRSARDNVDGLGIIKDYRGVSVLSVYSNCGFDENFGTDFNWALIAEIDEAEIKEPINELILFIVIAAAIIIGIVVVIAVMFSKSISRPLIYLKNIAEKIAQGNFQEKVVKIRSDEIGDLGLSINKMIAILRDVSQVAEKLATGDTSVRVKEQGKDDLLAKSINQMVVTINNASEQADVISSGNYNADIRPRSDKDKLGKALQRMTAQLRSSSAQNTKQIWISEGLSGINDNTRGETDMRKMAMAVCKYLAKYLDIEIMTFYIVYEDKLRLAGSYAFNKRKSAGYTIDFNEGLVGQAAAERGTISITNVPRDYTRINSSIGDSYPRNIVVTPFVVGDTVYGVIEIGAFEELSDDKLELLELLKEPVGVIIRSILEQNKTKELLEETQRQAEELQSQQEELKSSNEQLEEQTQLLKQSEEELKQQTEELRVSNEELKENQEQLKKQKDEVEASKNDVEIKASELALASKYKSDFLANMSHEFRTPLNSLLLLSKDLADNKKGHLDEDEVEDVRVIHDGGKDLLNLINDIMDLSKVEAGMMDITIEDVRIDTVTRNMQKIFNPVAGDKGLTFKVDIEDNIPEVIKSDGQRVEQILKNLLSNAMKFTENGSVTLKIMRPENDVRFRHSGLSTDTAIAFAVIDTGVGIPADKQQDIFEAFQQQDGSTVRKYGGTGLGLTISRELAHLLGGEIEVKSVQGAGSVFTLYLPKELNQDSIDQTREKASSPGPVKEDSNQNLSKPVDKSAITHSLPQFIPDDRKDIHEGDKTLLIIDDDKNFARTLRNHGRKNGYKCLVAGDGRSGTLLAKEHEPDGILLDIGLPDIDGHQVLEQLKFSLKTRHIPVQVISACDKDQVKSLRQGAIGYLTKPVNEGQLNTVLKDISKIAKTDVKNILIVDDDKGSRRAITGTLKSSGVNIKSVRTGKEGVNEILSNEYDCLILDIGLPDMSGFDVLNKINGNKSTKLPPVLIFTGRELTDEEYKELNKFSSTIVIKGASSSERLLDDVSLFLHSVESQFKNGRKETIRLLHDEDVMLKGRKILLVDDDMRNTYALSKNLIDIGFNVEMAKNGLEAVDILEKDHSYELVLMDIMMPVMDGYEATRRILS